MIKKTGIQLVQSFYPVIHLEADPEFAQGDFPDVNMEIGLGLQFRDIDKDKGRWTVALAIELKWPDDIVAPYKKSRLVHFGLFELDPAMEKEVFEKHLSISAPSMLYSAARGFLKMLTAEGPYASIILPSVYFKHQAISVDGKTKNLE